MKILSGQLEFRPGATKCGWSEILLYCLVFWHDLDLTGSKFDALRCLCIYETSVILVATYLLQIIVRKWVKDYIFFYSKVYVQFGRRYYPEKDERHFHTRIPGRVSMAVYRAVKLRQLRIPCILHLLK